MPCYSLPTLADIFGCPVHCEGVALRGPDPPQLEWTLFASQETAGRGARKESLQQVPEHISEILACAAKPSSAQFANLWPSVSQIEKDPDVVVTLNREGRGWFSP